MEINSKQLEELCKQMSDKIKPCPKCGKKRHVSAIFEDDESQDIVGWIQYCPDCDNDNDVEMFPIEELDWNDKN